MDLDVNTEDLYLGSDLNRKDSDSVLNIDNWDLDMNNCDLGSSVNISDLVLTRLPPTWTRTCKRRTWTQMRIHVLVCLSVCDDVFQLTQSLLV